jgi:hypothetical protein
MEVNSFFVAIIDGYNKGVFSIVEMEKTLKVKKGFSPITKKSSFQVQLGVEYDNKKSVIEKRADGTLPAENTGLPWGEWLQYPYVIQHKGEQYLRVSLFKGSYKPTAAYFQDGVEITREQAQAQAYASEFTDHSGADCFSLKASNIVRVGKFEQ